MIKEVVPDFSVPPRHLVEIGMNRPLEAHLLDARVSFSLNGEQHDVNLSEQSDERTMSLCLNEALKLDSEPAQTLIKEGLEQILYDRQTSHSNAAAIFFANNKANAHEISHAIMAIDNSITPTVLTEDCKDPVKIFEEFAKSDDPAIVAVDMLKEGINLNRTRVIVHLSNTSALMPVTQMWTRGVRKEDFWQTGPSRIYAFDTPQFRSVANSIEELTLHQLEPDTRAREARGSSGGESHSHGGSTFVSLGAVATQMSAVYRGSTMPSEAIVIAKAFRSQHPEIAAGLADSQIAAIAQTFAPDAIPVKPKFASVETYDETRKRLKQTAQSLANRLAYATGREYRDVHSQWIGMGNPRHENATNDDLQRKIHWLVDEISNQNQLLEL